MKKIKENGIVIVIILIIFSTYFYWDNIRPSQIRHKCFTISAIDSQPEKAYGSCLRNYGLVK